MSPEEIKAEYEIAKAQYEIAEMENVAKMMKAEMEFRSSLKQYEQSTWKDAEKEWWTEKIESLKEPTITAIQHEPFISEKEMEL